MVSEPIRDQLPVLPRPRSPLVGRAQETAVARSLLTEANVPLLTLTGPGGVGKTRLALEIAAAADEAFADGVAFVSLAAVVDPALLLPTVAQVVGVSQGSDRPLVELLAAALRPRQLLLVLDNLEQLVAAASDLADLLAVCPALQILATSRAPLRVRDEREFPVPPLALPEQRSGANLVEIARAEAVALFVRCATAVHGQFALTEANAPVVAEICRRLDGLPLAIELAAARIKILSPEALLALLTHRLKLLTGGPRDMPARQQTMRNAVAWSDALLDPGEQALLRRLAVFAGGCTLPAVAAVCDQDVYTVLDGLTTLVDQSLLRRIDGPNVEPRFLMLETIREYSIERLVEHGEDADYRRRHADWCLALGEDAATGLAGADQATWLTRLDAEHDNLRAALSWALDQGDPETALRLAVALWRFWYIRGHIGEGLSWLERALEVAPAAPAATRAAALNGAGALAHAQGALDQAATYFSEALTQNRAAGSGRGAANALNNLGILAWYAGDLTRAAAMHEEALALFRDLDDQDGIATSLNTLGNVAHHRGDYARAVSLHGESVERYRSLDDRHGSAVALISLGMAIFENGDAAAAVDLYEESLALCRQLSFREGIAASLNNLGDVDRTAGRPNEATARYEESLTLYQELENQRGIAVSLRNLGLLARERGHRAEATALAVDALHRRITLGDRDGIAEGLEDLAALAASDHADRAARLYGAAESLRHAVEAPVRASERDDHARHLATIRARLARPAFAAAWSAGRALTTEEAVAEALSPAAEGGRRKAAMAETSSVPSDQLTRREMDVLRLLAERRTDKEIAETLFISPRTVMAHVASILGKLDVDGRREAASYAIRHGLV